MIVHRKKKYLYSPIMVGLKLCDEIYAYIRNIYLKIIFKKVFQKKSLKNNPPFLRAEKTRMTK